jgi:hypothetical protein
MVAREHVPGTILSGLNAFGISDIQEETDAGPTGR